MQDISSRMDAVCRRFEELSIRLNQPDTAADPALFRKLMREYHDTEPVVEAYRKRFSTILITRLRMHSLFGNDILIFSYKREAFFIYVRR